MEGMGERATSVRIGDAVSSDRERGFSELDEGGRMPIGVEGVVPALGSPP
jgi:hypothetical protein